MPAVVEAGNRMGYVGINSWQKGKNGKEGQSSYAIVTSRSYHPDYVHVVLMDGSSHLE